MTKSVNIKVNMNLNDKSLTNFGKSIQKIFLQWSTFPNEPWKENFLDIEFRQVDQKSQNSGKLIPQNFGFYKIGIFKVMFLIW